MGAFPEPSTGHDRPSSAPSEQERAVRLLLDSYCSYMRRWIADQPHWRLLDPEILQKAFFANNPPTHLQDMRKRGADVTTEYFIDEINGLFRRFRAEEAASRFVPILEARLEAERYTPALREEAVSVYTAQDSALLYYPVPSKLSRAPGIEDVVVELLLGCSAPSELLKAKNRDSWFFGEARLRKAYSAVKSVQHDMDAMNHLASNRTGIDTSDRNAQCLPAFLDAMKEIRYILRPVS
ncbi:hypothetical protein KY359_01455 [Candidatus Woesearchaeota archaeon]|nr:hypothetical protein [Candidatus Woesearchaeota archaeon]